MASNASVYDAQSTNTPQRTRKSKRTVKEEPLNKPYEGDAFTRHFGKRFARELIVLDSKGKALRSTISSKRTILYASLLNPLTTMARNVVRDLDPSNDITFLRMRSEFREVFITMGPEFKLIVIQKVNLVSESRLKL